MIVAGFAKLLANIETNPMLYWLAVLCGSLNNRV